MIMGVNGYEECILIEFEWYRNHTWLVNEDIMRDIKGIVGHYLQGCPQTCGAGQSTI